MKLKIVLDSNIFVSAVLKPKSKPGIILDMIKKDKVVLLISYDILMEIRHTLLYPKLKKFHKKNKKWIDNFIYHLEQISVSMPGKIKIRKIKKDLSDNIFLECAVEGKADYIISGDKHLKELRKYGKIKILSPAEYLKLN